MQNLEVIVKTAFFGFIGGLVFFPANLHASSSEIVEKLAYYKGLSRLKAPFTQTKSMQGASLEIVTSGELEVVWPDSVRWEVQKPANIKVLINEKRIKVVTPEGSNEYLRSDKKMNRVFKSLSEMKMWLMFDVEKILESYKVSKVTEDEFHFIPTKENSGFFKKIEVLLTKEGRIDRLKMREISGDLMAIDFGKTVVWRK